MDALALPGTTRLSQSTGHRRCARCGKVVSRRALACRRCGKKQRVNPRSMMLLGAGFFLIALFAVATAGPRIPFIARLRGDVSVAPVAAALSPAAPSPAIMTASELWASYGADPAAADAKWKGKFVAVTGMVIDGRRDYRGRFFVRLATGDNLETVHAAIVFQDVDARTLPSRGQTVSLRCTGAGRSIGSPLLEGCRLL